LPPGRNLRADVLSLEEDLRRELPSEARELKQLRDENVKLKRLVADLSLDKAMLQDVVSKKFWVFVKSCG
jgi:cell division protein FtsB